jgi:hypothetical protein
MMLNPSDRCVSPVRKTSVEWLKDDITDCDWDQPAVRRFQTLRDAGQFNAHEG